MWEMPNLIKSSVVLVQKGCGVKPSPPLHTTRAEKPELKNCSRSQKPHTWWPQRSPKQGNSPALYPPCRSPPQQAEGYQPQMHVLQPPCTARFRQPQLHLREEPSPSTLGLEKYSPCFWSLPCCKRNGGELKKM